MGDDCGLKRGDPGGLFPDNDVEAADSILNVCRLKSLRLRDLLTGLVSVDVSMRCSDMEDELPELGCFDVEGQLAGENAFLVVEVEIPE